MRGEVAGALRRLGDVCLNSPRLKTVRRVELECVGVTEAREAWVRAWGGAVMVGDWSVQASFARRGQGRSVASIFVFGLQLFDDGSGGYGAPLVAIVGVREAVVEGVLHGKARARGVVSGRLARGR